MRKRSSRIFFQGKYHNEIVIDGKYHDKVIACYADCSTEVLWEKLGGSIEAITKIFDQYDVIFFNEKNYFVLRYQYYDFDAEAPYGDYYGGIAVLSEDSPSDSGVGDGKTTWHLMLDDELLDIVSNIKNTSPTWYTDIKVQTNGKDIVFYRYNTTVYNAHFDPRLTDSRCIQVQADRTYNTDSTMALDRPIVLSDSGLSTIIVWNSLFLELNTNGGIFTMRHIYWDGTVVAEYTYPTAQTSLGNYHGMFACDYDIYLVFNGGIFKTDMYLSKLERLFTSISIDVNSIKIAHTEQKTFIIFKCQYVRTAPALFVGGVMQYGLYNFVNLDIPNTSLYNNLSVTKKADGRHKLLVSANFSNGTAKLYSYNDDFEKKKEKSTTYSGQQLYKFIAYNDDLTSLGYWGEDKGKFNNWLYKGE